MTIEDKLEMRLPKAIEADPHLPRVEAALRQTRPLWSGAESSVPVAKLDAGLRRALMSALSAGRVTRGLELAEKKLEGEARGMATADRRSGASRGERVSRLLLVANDGAERMYRRAETLQRRHPGRLLIVQLEASADDLGELLFGSSSVAKAVLLDHKDAVADVLFAMAGVS